MLAVLVWGVILSIGAGLYGVHPRTGEITYAPNPLRGVVLLLCVLAFLGFWRLMLGVRAKAQ
jgi:hypothetical protein